MTQLTADESNRPNRRDFLCSTSTLAAGGALVGGLAIGRTAHAAGSDVLKIGVIGCGNRGTGAVLNAFGADQNSKLVAMADAFGDRLEDSLKLLRKHAAGRVAVEPNHCFVGLDAGKKLIATDVDVVLLTEPPHFRPAHLKLAIDAGKQVFCEKPVAVDGPGVRSVLATVAEAKKKNLNIVSGLCWRFHPGARELIKRVHDGAIGEIKSIQETYLGNRLGFRPRKPGWTEMEYQIRNWQYFVWLSGDFNTEQHVHSLDKAAWLMRDVPPMAAFGIGGRECRAPVEGDIYDHHAVVYECANDVNVHAYCRQIAGCDLDVTDRILGTKGCAIINAKDQKITGENTWKYKPPKNAASFYDLEHQALFAAIRSGNTINNGDYMAKSTMWAILGRMADFTGQRITWDQAMNSQEVLAPAEYSFAANPPVLPDKNDKYPIAVPGRTKFV